MYEEGPAAYFLTWYADFGREAVCRQPRVVRLTGDRRFWRAELFAVWQQDLIPHFHVDVFFADPEPSRTPWQHYLGHIMLVQRRDDDQVATIVSLALPDPVYPTVLQAMYRMPQRVSMMDIVEQHAPEICTNCPCRVRRGNQIFPAVASVRIGNGDSLEIDVLPSRDPPRTDATSLLQHSARVTRDQDRVRISLEATIPTKDTIVEDNHFHPELLIIEDNDIAQKVNSDQLRFVGLPEDLSMSAVSLHALQEPELYCEPPLANRLVFYVDGSAKQDRATWSVVAVSYDWQAVPALIGVLAGPVVCNQQDQRWVGATHADNIAAELHAAVAAFVAALSLPHTGMMTVRPDLRLSAMIAANIWSCKSHTKLAQVTRWLGDWMLSLGGSCLEVRGHSAHPWNDLADGVAKFALRNDATLGKISFDACHNALVTGDISWLWLQHQSSTIRHCFPRGTSTNTWIVTPSVHKVDYQDPSRTMMPNDNDWISVDFTIATANVLALNQKDDFQDGESVSARAERLSVQWHEAKLAIVGVQESRRPEGRYFTEHYQIYASGAQIINGIPHYGCELWIHRTLSVGTGEHRMRLADFRHAVTWADPRRLFVHLQGSSFDFSHCGSSCPVQEQAYLIATG